MAGSFKEFQNTLRDGREVYYRGKRVDDVTKHPVLGLHVNLYRYHFNEKYFYQDSDLGVKTSKFYKVPRSSSDLLERSNLTYDINKEAGVVMPHIGSDATFALMITTDYLEKKYRERFKRYATRIRKDNLFLAAAQIDVKGNRKLRPSGQEDPDMYVHVCEERRDGIVVRGAKAHTTWSIPANEIYFLPSRSFQKGEEDYAISFALPANASGLKMITRPAIASEGAMHPWEGVRTRKRSAGETLTILDNVFVPWERVFVYKNTEAASDLALLFALWHRLSAISYRAGMAEYLIGLGKLIAYANGIDNATHVQKDITDLISFAEIQRMCAKMAAYECNIDKKTGIAVPNSIYTNVGKLYSNETYLNVIKSLIDIAGGFAITVPSGDDYSNDKLRPYIDKYLSGAIPGEDRFKLFLLLREVIALLGGEEAVIHIHAEGSILASIIELYRSYDYSGPTKLIQNLLLQMK